MFVLVHIKMCKYSVYNVKILNAGSTELLLHRKNKIIIKFFITVYMCVHETLLFTICEDGTKGVSLKSKGVFTQNKYTTNITPF